MYRTVYRTHTCGQLRGENEGQEVTLAGWVSRVRDLGGLVFMDLRDRYGKTQICAEGTTEIAKVIRSLGIEDVVQVHGCVRKRPERMVNKAIATGEIEVEAQKIVVLSSSSPLPFGIEDEEEPGEELRLRFRYLDLRRFRMQRNLELRHRLLQTTRQFFTTKGFWEVETPFLIRSTPEGARDYLVPSRLHRGKWYALPQSPQLYKQTLMIGGIDRYFQIVRCFRDEDLRRDRQPEFTQIDVEMSFVGQEDVISVVEQLMVSLVETIYGTKVTTPFPRMTYEEAVTKFGTDAPDLRYDMKIVNIDEVFQGGGLRSFEDVLAQGGKIYGLKVEGKSSLSRRERQLIEEEAHQEGLAGLIFTTWREGRWEGVIGKVLDLNRSIKLKEVTGIQEGDALFLSGGESNETLAALGRLRRKWADRWRLVDNEQLSFCWVIEPPLFEIDKETKRLVSVHHPFTAPLEEDIEHLEIDPLKVRARAYDLVLNGAEIGSGSIRIHNPRLQLQLLRLLGWDENEAKRRFGFLLEAFSYGAPPHGGIALGFDRIVMLLARELSIREVIAFPKTNIAVSLMDGAPAEIDPQQWEELGLKMKKSNENS